MDESAKLTVVLRFRDGKTLRCVLTREFSIKEFTLEVETDDGATHNVDVADLKAVFFLKDPKQRTTDMALDERDLPEGALARVEFFDGEIIRGRVTNYNLGDAGFYLFPTASESNNDRVFVVATALNTVSIEG